MSVRRGETTRPGTTTIWHGRTNDSAATAAIAGTMTVGSAPPAYAPTAANERAAVSAANVVNNTRLGRVPSAAAPAHGATSTPGNESPIATNPAVVAPALVRVDQHGRPQRPLDHA